MSQTDLQAQAAAAEALIAAGRGDAHDHMVAALGRSERGDLTGAEALFDRALALEPANPAILTGLAILRRQQRRLRDAVLACDAAIRAAQDYADAWLERGVILTAGGSNTAARASFARAADLAPWLAPAHAGLAALAAREGDGEGARRHALAALQRDPANAVAACALASAELAAGNPEAARALLEPVVERLDQPSNDRSLAWGTLGDAYDRLGQTDAAYQAYARSKADFAMVESRDAGDELDNRQFVKAIAAGMAAVQDWSAPSLIQPAKAAHKHLFLLGYPRSGTTLVENVLASLPGVSALEERPTLGMTDRKFLMGDHDQVVAGLAAFAALDAGAIEGERAAYWDLVTASGIAPSAPCFVDMDPIKGTRLPLIARLFPEAKILVMRRDPRDVVWSCFRTNFGVSSGTLEYTSLERTARHYDALMRLTEAAMARLPLAFHEVHYHRLVQDFDATTREVCAFAGLDWSEALHRFDRTAARRGVSTASSSQVRRGLYDGTRQWERYARYLEPVMPILNPWIEKLGYS
ncbi:MAG: tetratricopeptide repeat-containing sulfotransferase family protein [Novosphingobium sp.]